MLPRAPLRVVDNPRFAEPARFRAALYRAARMLAAQPMTAADLHVINAAQILLDQAPHTTTPEERGELAKVELALAAALLRAARQQEAGRARRLARESAAGRIWRLPE
jgi:hypothetical protein